MRKKEKTLSRGKRVISTPSPFLHKLHGKLIGLWACQVEYDCRIVFTFEKDPDNKKDLIVLVDIGKHDEVY
ncbi:plasmid stabilization protein [Thermodesulfobacteriota bacterium]